MPEAIIRWLAQAGVLGGVAGLVLALGWTIKTAGPELREWVTMIWARKDAKTIEVKDTPAAIADDLPDAA